MADEKVMCVVPVSGGKDSQACLALAVGRFGADSVRGIFCDTRFEHPETYGHVERMRAMYGVRIDVVCAGSVVDQCLKHGRFPSDVARFCTDELKMRPSRDWYRALAESQGGFEVWYGMRTGEGRARADRYADVCEGDLIEPHEMFPSKYPKLLSRLGVRFRLPVVDWLESDVFEFLGDAVNPLYSLGFGRVGCFPCLAGGARQMARAFGFDSFGHAQAEKVAEVGRVIGRDPMTGREHMCGVCLI